MARIERIVVALDGSELAESALPMAELLAPALDAHIELLHVHGVTYSEGRDPVEQDVLESAEAYLEERARALESATRASVDTVLLEGPVAGEIVGYLEKGVPSLLIMTTHGRSGLNRLWLGSVAENAVRSAPSPVLLVRPEPDAPGNLELDHVLVALDGSERAERALPWARAVARALGTDVTLLRVVASENDRDEAMKGLAAVARQGEEPVVAVHDTPVDAILEEARGRGSVLVALTTRGRGALTRNLFGSVADKIVRSAEVPLLVLNEGNDSD